MSTFPIYKLKEIPPKIKEKIMKRSELDVSQIEKGVRKIIGEVKEKGDEAIAEFLSTQVGKKVKPSDIKVKEADISSAYKELDGKVIRALKHLIRNVKRFHKRQMPQSWFIEIEDGVYAGQYVVPVDSTGLYVPSGKASYPSVAAMVTIPAKVAGVRRIAVASPPHGNEMKMDPASLVAAHLSGAHEFYIMGGAHAIAAFAYGTKLVRPVDVIAGPGGPWTHAAKKMVRDVVKLDLPAGPSEGMVLADGTVLPRQVAWNVLGEAEHGPDSAGVLVTTSYEFAEEVAEEIDRVLEEVPEPRLSYIKENAKKYSAIIVCDNLDEAIDFINQYAPEHLAIDSKHAKQIFNKYKGRLKNFGTLCLNTPISAGNFGIGPNSTLPTGGYARLYSGLNVDVFLRKPTLEMLRGKGWRRMSKTVITLAEYEGFPCHYKAMESRL